MRKFGIMVFSAAASIFLTAVTAQAAENFIPQGHTYTPDSSFLPPLNSAQDRINLQADIFESEINSEQRRRKLIENDFSSFISSQSLDGSARWDY